jgi:hypothetical protein
MKYVNIGMATNLEMLLIKCITHTYIGQVYLLAEFSFVLIFFAFSRQMHSIENMYVIVKNVS